MHNLQGQLDSFFQKYPDVYGPNTGNDEIRKLNVTLAAAYYVSFSRGASAVVQVDSQSLENVEAVWTDSGARSIGITAGKYGGAIPSKVKMVMEAIFEVKNLYSSEIALRTSPLFDGVTKSLTLKDKAQVVIKSIKNTGNIKTVNGILTTLKNLSAVKKGLVVAGAALAVVSAAAILTASVLYTAFYLSGDMGKQLSQALNLVSLTIAVVSAAIAVKTFVSTVKASTSVVNFLTKLSGLFKFASAVGAIIGLVLGVAVSFGIFRLQYPCTAPISSTQSSH